MYKKNGTLFCHARIYTSSIHVDYVHVVTCTLVGSLRSWDGFLSSVWRKAACCLPNLSEFQREDMQVAVFRIYLNFSEKTHAACCLPNLSEFQRNDMQLAVFPLHLNFREKTRQAARCLPNLSEIQRKDRQLEPRAS